MGGLFQAGGNDADDAGVPAVGGGPDQGAVKAARFGLGEGFFADGFGDLATIGVQLVQLGGDAGGLDVVVGGQKARAKVGLADAAPRVDPGAEEEAEGIGGGGLVHAARHRPGRAGRGGRGGP